jgi:hypothetical protein
MNWWFVLFDGLFAPLVWWAMWREDFDGMRTEAQIKKHAKLSLDDFYAQFYSDSGISPTLIRRILNISAEQFGISMGCIRPTDNFLQTNLADTMYYVVEISEEFDLPRSWQDALADLDGTFDNIVRHVARHPEIAG